MDILTNSQRQSFLKIFRVYHAGLAYQRMVSSAISGLPTEPTEYENTISEAIYKLEKENCNSFSIIEIINRLEYMGDINHHTPNFPEGDQIVKPNYKN